MINLIIILVIIIIAVIMGLTDFIGHKISGLAAGHRDSILSFSSGLLISLLFLILVPNVISLGNSLGNSEFLFLFMLVGFLLMHLAEKYIYRHIIHKQELLEDLKIVHVIRFFNSHQFISSAISADVNLLYLLGFNRYSVKRKI